MQRVGMLGLGRMGLPIARRLHEAGVPLVVFDPDPTRSLLARQAGMTIASSERGVGEGSEVLITVLPGPQELRAALLGPGDALAGLDSGALWLDFTSSDPTTATEIAAAALARGVGAVGAPMGGDPNRAAAGTLRFHVGGDDASVDRILDLLGLLGDPDHLIRTGTDIASGYVTKLLSNTLWFGQVVAVTEVLLLGQALGLDIEGLRDALASGPGGSAFIDHHLDALLEGDYLTSFGLPRIVEELDAVADLASSAGTPSELTDLVARLHREALAHFGPIDGELAAAKLLEARAGRTLRTVSPTERTMGLTGRPGSTKGTPMPAEIRTSSALFRDPDGTLMNLFSRPHG